VGDLPWLTGDRGDFLNNSIRNGRQCPSDKGLHFNQTLSEDKTRSDYRRTVVCRGAHIMKKINLAILAALLLSANATAAIQVDGRQARNMDDVQSLGVIYINHNFATESEATEAINAEADARDARYYHVMLTREPGSNGNMHVSADIYR